MKNPTDHLHDRGTDALLSAIANTPIPQCTCCGAPLTEPGASSVCGRCRDEATRAKDRARPRLHRHARNFAGGLPAVLIAGAGFLAAFHQAEPSAALPTPTELSPAGPHEATPGTPRQMTDDPWRGFLWTT